MLQCRHRFPLLVLIFLVIHTLGNNEVKAQSLSFYKTEKVIVSNRWMKNIPSATFPQILQYPKLGTAHFSEAGGGYVLWYDNQGIAEYDTLVFQADGEIHAYALKNKFVVSADDYHMGERNSSFLVDVLVNDAAYSDLQLTDIAFSEGVDARIENQKIRIDATNPGLYYVYYTACDGGQNCDEAKLTLLIIDPYESGDTIVLKDVLEQKLVLPLPDDTYQLVRSSPENIFAGEESFEVHFFRQDFGENEIVFQSDEGRTLVYQIDFVNKWKKNGLNSRDRIFLQPENSISVDLTTNDLWKNIYKVETEHPDLNISTSGGGTVRIEPVKNFLGRTKFNYVTCAFPRCDTAEVVVYVDHFQPAKDVFDIDVDPSESSEIPFHTPVHNYNFSIIDQPENGRLSLTDEGRGFLFTPSSGFKGEETARIRYSHPLSKGNEFTTEHELRLSATDRSRGAACSDCVWPGDTDQSGLVDLGDLENIGRFIGEKGGARRAGDQWLGQTGNSWLSFEDEKLHHYDADGDGLISENDVLTVLKNHGKEHGIYANPVVLKNIPVEIVSSQGEIELGEEVVLEFLVGDDDHILTDVNGFSAEIEVDGGMLEKEQVEVIKDQSTWLKSYQPTLALKASSGDNQIAVGEFRVRSIGVDGRGTALKIRIIVEDEIEGFRTSRAKSRKSVRIIIKNMTLHAGEDKVRLPDQILELPVKEGEEKTQPAEDEVLLYPVPAGDYLKVVWKSSQEVHSIGLYNTTGMMLHKYDIKKGTTHLNINTGSLPEGMYILQLNDREKTRVRKVPVVR